MARLSEAPAGPSAPAAPAIAAGLPVGHRFGLAVRQLREMRGLSQEKLAARADLNRSYMGEIERAAVMPSLATAAKLAHALDVPLWQLIQRCEDDDPRDAPMHAADRR